MSEQRWITTDFIFNGQSCKPYKIDSQPCPVSVYGQTELDGENVVKQVMEEDAGIIKTAWLYSSHGHAAQQQITHVKDRAAHDRRYATNTEKIFENLDFP